jgi:hypothetical protein
MVLAAVFDEAPVERFKGIAANGPPARSRSNPRRSVKRAPPPSGCEMNRT